MAVRNSLTHDASRLRCLFAIAHKTRCTLHAMVVSVNFPLDCFQLVRRSAILVFLLEERAIFRISPPSCSA